MTLHNSYIYFISYYIHKNINTYNLDKSISVIILVNNSSYSFLLTEKKTEELK